MPFGAAVPIIGAPMAGGPSGPALVTAVGRAGGLGFLAAGYKTPDAVAEQIAAVRADGMPFGVNLFAPNPLPVDPVEYAAYASSISADARLHGLAADVPITEDDDHWRAKIDLLLADPVPVASFTFGFPDRSVIHTLQRAGTVVLLTITSAAEAQAAAGLRPDGLLVQSAEAGGHYGTLTPRTLPTPLPLTDLLAAVAARTDLPLIGAGGVGTVQAFSAALRAGAAAVAVGTVLVTCEESSASPVYRSALLDPSRDRTVITRAFTGRPARGLANGFTEQHRDGPFGYPALHHLTSPMRKAATAAGDAERINLWAGTGWKHARTGPVADAITELIALA